MMKAKNKSTQPNSLDQEVASIEAMTDEEINRELESYGIDPQRAVAKVTATVRSKMSEWDKRGHHHADKTVAHYTSGPHAINGEE